jgi:hypothetical protein
MIFLLGFLFHLKQLDFGVDGSCGYPADGLEHGRARVSLSKIGRAAGGFRFGAGVVVIVRGDEDKGWVRTLSHEPLRQLDPGHSPELDVQQEAIEPRLLRIR